ncbi:MAG: hypothetical protein GY799_18885 [Desulfobulbaceae bacterium]|nr:hypothetical protein [Desulfobulbaceae bacterium]
MADNKASEAAMERLHGKVAEILFEQLTASATVINEDGEAIEMSMVTPAMIGQAIKFLKDNDITSTPEIGDDLDNLAELLSKKQKKGRAQLSTVPAKQAAAEE